MTCKGIVYKAEVNTFLRKKGVGFSVNLIIQKKKSCPGCGSCGWVHESISENIASGIPLIGIESVENGKLYTLSSCNVSRDWETGVVDDYGLELIEIEV